MGGIPMKTYETFLNSDNETERAKAAFQVVRRFWIYTQYTVYINNLLQTIKKYTFYITFFFKIQ